MRSANNILNDEDESPKAKIPIRNVATAPIPVQTIYAVAIGICRWARYKNTPLSSILTAERHIYSPNCRG